MIKRAIVVWYLFAAVSFGSSVLPGDGYLYVQDEKTGLVIADEYKKERSKLLEFENRILSSYEKLFGYELDDRLYLVLASSRNQISNAYSTQIPLNMQVNYIGGSLLYDYFSTASWLKTILIHESAHNFQLNAKKNPLSSFAYKIVKNTPFTSLFFVPVFPIPNIFESSFILEGNAVLNESLFGNGGRLYSGAALALTLTQAKAGYITPQRSYNDHLFFPYGEHHYIVGGFFQLFLAQKYGLEKTDRYFLSFSNQWLPFFTNSVFRSHFGKNFEEELEEYNRWLLKKYEGFLATKGEKVAFSKSSVSLSGDDRDIFFLTTNQKSAPELVIYDKKDGSVKTKKGNFLFGKVFKIDEEFYTQTFAKTNRDKIEVALFDKNGVMKKASGSRVLQAILPDGEELYFDVRNSLDDFKLYRGDSFYKSVNSGVVTDAEGNIYYFVQSGKDRTLYKNKKPLFTFRGYYSKVVDIDSKRRILFIANSKYGSTLYRYDSGVVRVLESDDILDAKLIDDESVLVEVIRADGIEMIKKTLCAKKENIFEIGYFFENSKVVDEKEDMNDTVSEIKEYSPLKNIHYSSLDQSFEFTEEEGLNFYIKASFGDPLEQNGVFLSLSKFDDETIASFGYADSETLLNYTFDIYAVADHAKDVRSRGYGANVHLNYPLYVHTFKRADLRASWHLDHDRDERSPLSAGVSYLNIKQFGYSFYPNDKNAFYLDGVDDRGNFIYSLKYDFLKGFDHEFFTGVSLQYAKSDSGLFDAKKSRGVWIDNSDFSTISDPSRFVMPSLSGDLYVAEAFKGELFLSKVFNFSAYYYSFALSLRREALYAKYRYYSLKERQERFDINEYTIGMTFETLLMHKGMVNAGFEFLFNDDIKEANGFRILVDMSF